MNFKYKKLENTDIPSIWVKIWNMLYYPHKQEPNIQPIIKALEAIGEDNIFVFMNRFTEVCSISKLYVNKLYTLYHAFISIL